MASSKTRTFWPKQQQQLLEVLHEMIAHPDIQAARHRVIEAFVSMLEYADTLSFPLTPSETEVLWNNAPERLAYAACMQELVRLVEQRAPRVAHAFEGHLEKALAPWILGPLGLADDVPMDVRMSHFLSGNSAVPDNPLGRRPNGDIYGLEKADPRHLSRHLLEIGDAQKARLPPKPRGRPPKKPSDPPAKRQSKLDPVLAKHAYELHRDGKDRLMIVRELFPHFDLSDRKARKKAIDHVRALVERGYINAARSAE
jgi:hypothetical protein